MKYCTSLLSLIFIFSLAVHAQPEVRTERIGMMRGVHDALVIDIPNVKKSWAEKAWRDFTSKYGKADKVRKTNEWLLQSAHLVNYPDIDYVNIFSEALEEEGSVRFAMWVETDTIFLSPDANPKGWESATQLMNDFSTKVALDLITMELDDKQKDLDKLRSDLDKLEKNHTKYVETIDRAHQDITTAESDIVENTKDQEALTVEMDQYSSMESDPDAAKALKKLEKNMRKLKNQNLSYHNSIASNTDRITQNETNIEQNLIDQENKRQEITAQEEVVAEVRTRLDAIRAGERVEINN